jgi:hypothetical protein
MCEGSFRAPPIMYHARTAKTVYRKFETNIPGNETARTQSQFLHHVSVSILYILTIGLPILLQENIWTYCGNI